MNIYVYDPWLNYVMPINHAIMLNSCARSIMRSQLDILFMISNALHDWFVTHKTEKRTECFTHNNYNVHLYSQRVNLLMLNSRLNTIVQSRTDRDVHINYKFIQYKLSNFQRLAIT